MLVPSPLLEFRYFIVPFLLFRVLVGWRGGKYGIGGVVGEFVGYLILNALTASVFLKGRNGVRIMW